MTKLPAPPYGPEVDVRDTSIPRETFAKLAVAEFGVDYETALGFANQAADRVEGRRSRQVRRAQHRAPRSVTGRALQ